MPLGVGGATPFQMASNHQTAANHAFRDTAPFDPKKQVRIKCTFCGCWAKKGCACYQCHRLPDGTLVKPPVKKRRSSAKTLSKGDNEDVKHDEAVGEIHGDVDGEGEGCEQSDKNPCDDSAHASNDHKEGSGARASDGDDVLVGGVEGEESPTKKKSTTQNPRRKSSGKTSTLSGTGAHKRPSVPDNALQHKFRETSAYDISAKQRMKCPSCGCWVTRGKACTLCKRVTT